MIVDYFARTICKKNHFTSQIMRDYIFIALILFFIFVLMFQVVLVDHLVTSPCCIVVKQCGWSTLTDGDMKMTKQLEINPDHKIIKKLKEMVDEGQQGNLAKQMVMLLFDSLLLASGFSLEDPKTHATTIQTMIGRFLPKFCKHCLSGFSFYYMHWIFFLTSFNKYGKYNKWIFV